MLRLRDLERRGDRDLNRKKRKMKPEGTVCVCVCLCDGGGMRNGFVAERCESFVCLVVVV